MKRLAVMLIFASLVACLAVTGCSGGGTGGSSGMKDASIGNLAVSPASSELEGVKAEITKANAHIEKKDLTVVDFEIAVTNNSDVDVMIARFHLKCCDADGNVLMDVPRDYNGETKVLSPGESATINTWFQRVLDAEAASVGIEMVEVISAAEMPPAHLPQPGGYLYQEMGDDDLANLLETQPVEIKVGIDEEGAQSIATFTEPQDVQRAVDAFAKIKVGDEVDEFVTDHYNWISFTFANGNRVGISINYNNLECDANGNWHFYELENLGEFWGMAVERAVPYGDGSHDDA